MYKRKKEKVLRVDSVSCYFKSTTALNLMVSIVFQIKWVDTNNFECELASDKTTAVGLHIYLYKTS